MTAAEPENAPDTQAPIEPAVAATAPPVESQESIETTTPQTSTKTSEDRKRLLADAIQRETVQGARIESSQDFQAAMVFGKPVNHILHVILSVVTFGVWIPVWIVLAIVGGEKRIMINIDDFGNVIRQKL